MPKNLVIVESPAKAKTIQKYLGSDFAVASSYGHIVDLPKKGMGIDIENNFTPEYEVSPDKKDVVKKLRAMAKKSEKVWLASDEDREGEAIAWHLYRELGLTPAKTERIVFHEITKTAIQKAVENPRKVDEDLVNAQQARRVLDRLVGFQVSPVLWRKVRTGLSAGRVQSVAVRLLVEREKEIRSFTPTSTFKFQGFFHNSQKKLLKGNLNHAFNSLEESTSFLNNCKDADFVVDKLAKRPGKRTPAAPFTTSTLQQEASRKLGMNVSRTMQIAQQLYEQGLITYMRTDSVNLSNDALSAAEKAIRRDFGDNYYKRRVYKTKNKGAQEAHEAIRPTNLNQQKAGLVGQQQSLYSLIWKRTLASQMSDAALERTTIDISAEKIEHKFQVKGEIITFDGFLRLYQEGTDDEDGGEIEGILPAVKEGEKLDTLKIEGTEKFSRPPARFTEASLVKKLEELGIGRPSTYAPTISTIQRRNYVSSDELEGKERKYYWLSLEEGTVKQEKRTEIYGAEKRKLIPTDIGIIVNDFLVEHFKGIMDYNFTAKVESSFDDIAQGEKEWTKMLSEFYEPFSSNVKDVAENAERAKGERLLGKHPESGKNVYARIGRYGPMVQIGEVEDEEKPKFASLLKTQNLGTINLEEALDLFKLPKDLGEYDGETVLVNIGRFGPYVKIDDLFVSIPKDEDPMNLDLARAIELIEEKRKADAPIYVYEGKDVTKGSGRFGPYIKWNDLFINVNKKYDFDNLTTDDLIELIEIKKQKEIDKVIHNWEEEGIRVEKARWGRSKILKGKTKIELGKEVDAKALTLEEVKAIIEKNAPKKKTAKKTAKKSTRKTSPKKK